MNHCVLSAAWLSFSSFFELVYIKWVYGVHYQTVGVDTDLQKRFVLQCQHDLLQRSVAALDQTPRAKCSTYNIFSSRTLRMGRSCQQWLKFLGFDSAESCLNNWDIRTRSRSVNYRIQDIAAVPISWLEQNTGWYQHWNYCLVWACPLVSKGVSWPLNPRVWIPHRNS